MAVLHPDTLILTDVGFKKLIDLDLSDKIIGEDGVRHSIHTLKRHNSVPLYSIKMKNGSLSCASSSCLS